MLSISVSQLILMTMLELTFKREHYLMMLTSFVVLFSIEVIIIIIIIVLFYMYLLIFSQLLYLNNYDYCFNLQYFLFH